MCKDSSARYFHKNKERLQNRLVKGIKIFPKKKKKKSSKMDVKDIKISQKTKNKG